MTVCVDDGVTVWVEVKVGVNVGVGVGVGVGGQIQDPPLRTQLSPVETIRL